MTSWFQGWVFWFLGKLRFTDPAALIEKYNALLACCEEYGHPCPNELRLIYDTRVGRSDVKYQYQPVLEMEDLSFSDLFTSWISEKKEEMRN